MSAHDHSKPFTTHTTTYPNEATDRHNHVHKHFHHHHHKWQKQHHRRAQWQKQPKPKQQIHTHIREKLVMTIRKPRHVLPLQQVWLSEDDILRPTAVTKNKPDKSDTMFRSKGSNSHTKCFTGHKWSNCRIKDITRSARPFAKSNKHHSG